MAELTFAYVAIDRAGRRVKGRVSAPDDATAFELLRRDGVAPLRLKAVRVREAASEFRRARLRPRECAEFLSGLAELLRAGADIRTALSILVARVERPVLRKVGEALSADISGGEPLDRAFARAFQASQPFVAPMVAAGEAAGDLPGGLERGAEVIASRLKLRDQLAAVLAYPLFVLVSAVAALFVILIYIVPSIAPLAAELGSEPPLSMAIMIAASDFLTTHLRTLGLILAAVLLGLLAAARLGVLGGLVGRILLDGPARRTTAGLVYGGFAQSLGAMVGAGAPIGEALRLAIRTVNLDLARKRLEPLGPAVRQGESLSSSLLEVSGFPGAIIRLTTVGEASNALGTMLQRSGRMEEEAALRRIEQVGRIAGPALIVILGALLGVLMAGLLSGVSQMGQTALE
ncbi:MAG: type II secretion system F family protein [Phenylobacterium sp.]|nr:type II secretion system F family protein [Phenylobacterium sp.]